MGKSFSFKVLELRIKRAWQLQHGCELVDIDKGYMVACFYYKEDYLKVMNGNPWIVLGHYITISKWRPHFKSKDSTIQTTLACVCIPSIPVEMLEDPSLLNVRDCVGRAIRLDPNTTDMIRGWYARICVELNLDAPLMPTVVVRGKKYSVV